MLPFCLVIRSMISQTNNGCSLFSLILAKLLLLDISCENIFALSIVTALTACLFSTKKCAKISVFLCKNRKISLAAGSYAPTLAWPSAARDFTPRPRVNYDLPLCQILDAPLLGPPPNLGPRALHHLNLALTIGLHSSEF